MVIILFPLAFTPFQLSVLCNSHTSSIFFVELIFRSISFCLQWNMSTLLLLITERRDYLFCLSSHFFCFSCDPMFCIGLADENESVREAALSAGHVLVEHYATSYVYFLVNAHGVDTSKIITSNITLLLLTMIHSVLIHNSFSSWKNRIAYSAMFDIFCCIKLAFTVV